MGKAKSSGSSSGSLFNYLLIVMFAGAIVALGAHDINETFNRRSGSRASRRASESMMNVLSSDVSASPEKTRAAQSAANSSSGDHLTRDDQKSLSNLLSQVVD